MATVDIARAGVERALHGRPGPSVVGLTFVPAGALSSMRWGKGRTPAILSAACSALQLDFIFVPASEPWAEEAMGNVAECGTAPMWVVDGPLQRYAGRSGWNEVLAESSSDPRAFAAALEAHALEAAREVEAGLGLDPVAVVVADDIAGSAGPLISPDVVIDAVVPALARAAAPATHAGILTAVHSDGDTRLFADAFAKAGFSAIHLGGVSGERFERAFEAFRAAGVAVIGGIDGDALRAGPISAIRAGVSAGVLSRRGGLLIADDGGITTGEELAAFVTAVSAARDEGSAHR